MKSTPLFMTPAAAADFVAVTSHTLKRMRMDDRKRAARGEEPEGPPWRERVTEGGRVIVIYETSKLTEWAFSFFHMSGSSPPEVKR